MRQSGRGLTVVPVDDKAETEADRTLSVQLELFLERRPISGRLSTERGTEERFVDWLGFVDALGRLRERDEEKEE
jgi:hypothetical protein